MEFIYEVLIVSFIVNILLFVPAFILQTDKFTDIGYALTFIFVALYGFLYQSASMIYTIAFIVVVLWALRLGSYLFYRIFNMKKDKRFDQMRKRFVSFLGFWLLQAVTVFIVSIGFTRLVVVDSSFNPLSLAGIVITLAGLLIESIADIQKFNFKKIPENSGKWTNIGLWKYARHPNYFGEMLVWWGIFIYGAFYLAGWSLALSVISPLFISFMMLYVSGIPLLRKRWDKKWGKDPKYQEYIKSTRLLVPIKK